MDYTWILLICKLASGFVAVFNSDLNSYYYSQGIVHVSSFGFGGTNAHAIFWGEDRCDVHCSSTHEAYTGTSCYCTVCIIYVYNKLVYYRNIMQYYYDMRRGSTGLSTRPCTGRLPRPKQRRALPEAHPADGAARGAGERTGSGPLGLGWSRTAHLAWRQVLHRCSTVLQPF